MSESNKEIVRLIKAMFDARQVKTMTPDGLRMWLDALSDLTVDQVAEAIRRFNREHTEFPTPAALRKCVTVATHNRSTVAWAAVRKAIRSVGAYRTVQFDDPITTASIHAMGGWVELCDTLSDQMQWKEKEFARHYESICKTGIGNTGLLYGICDQQNMRDGLLQQAEVKIDRVMIGLPKQGIERKLLAYEHQQKVIGNSPVALKLAQKFEVKDIPANA